MSTTFINPPNYPLALVMNNMTQNGTPYALAMGTQPMGMTLILLLDFDIHVFFVKKCLPLQNFVTKFN